MFLKLSGIRKIPDIESDVMDIIKWIIPLEIIVLSLITYVVMRKSRDLMKAREELAQREEFFDILFKGLESNIVKTIEDVKHI